MKICIISTSDVGHGAGVAAYRLFLSLRDFGHQVKMIVSEKITSDKDIISIRSSSEVEQYKFEKTNFSIFQGFFSSSLYSADVRKILNWADIVNIHATHHHKHFFSLFHLLRKKVVWTLHDMWAMTGHCIFPVRGCNKWKSGCIDCQYSNYYLPIVTGGSSKSFYLKKLFFKIAKPTIVVPSLFLQQNCKSSPILSSLNTSCIPYCVDPFFRPAEKSVAKRNLGLPLEMPCVLFGAGHLQDERKGFVYFAKAVNALSKSHAFSTLVFGDGNKDIYKYLPKNSCILGKVEDRSLLLDIFNAADVFVMPTLMDNLPNVVLESMACATPVVAFDTGGISDMVENGKNGFICTQHDIDGLVTSIKILILNAEMREEMGRNAVKSIERTFVPPVLAAQYTKLFKTILK